MKKLSVLFASLFMSVAMFAQNNPASTTPQISVNGTGKVSITPDQAVISVGVENKGDDAASVKKANDAAIAKVIGFIKGMKISEKDYQTQRVNLYKNRDYDKKKDYYQASQTIVITLKDISKYEALVMGLMDSGINQIEGVEFKSSKTANYETEARTKAVQDARKKAEDYANALGQKLGKAIVVSDQSYQTPIARPYMLKAQMVSADSAGLDETLAVGEIEVVSNVSISFVLD